MYIYHSAIVFSLGIFHMMYEKLAWPGQKGSQFSFQTTKHRSDLKYSNVCDND